MSAWLAVVLGIALPVLLLLPELAQGELLSPSPPTPPPAPRPAAAAPSGLTRQLMGGVDRAAVGGVTLRGVTYGNRIWGNTIRSLIRGYMFVVCGGSVSLPSHLGYVKRLAMT